MYSQFRHFCERLLRIPPDPEPPPGAPGSAQIFRAAPNFYKYLLFIWAAGSAALFILLCWFSIAPIAGGISVLHSGRPWGALLFLIPGSLFGLFILIRMFRLAVLKLEFEKRWYVLSDRSLRIREGVVTVREMTVTFANIQNISIAQGPVQRLLGIADLKVETAGGGAAQNQKNAGPNLHTAWFRGIDNAAEIRRAIQERLRQYKDSGLGDRDEVLAGNLPMDSQPVIQALREVLAESRKLGEAVARRDAGRNI